MADLFARVDALVSLAVLLISAISSTDIAIVAPSQKGQDVVYLSAVRTSSTITGFNCKSTDENADPDCHAPVTLKTQLFLLGTTCSFCRPCGQGFYSRRPLATRYRPRNKSGPSRLLPWLEFFFCDS